jgi:RNA polymerase sigma-70 factor, ECF subfamily
VNQTEFLQIFDAHGGSIFGFIYNRVGRHKELAEDISQEVFVRAWRERERFDPAKGGIKTWLFTIARNLIIDHYRAQARRQTDSLENVPESHTATHSSDASLLMHFLTGKLPELSEEDCELITLRYIEQLELEEIAEIIEKNYNATKVAVHRALYKLRDLINSPDTVS